MLELLLSAHDGGTAWRHLLADGEARAGFECVGPKGLARRIGRVLGVPTEAAEAPARLAALAQKLDRHDDGSRAYSASRSADPFGVARHLLQLRDALRLAGWDGGPLAGSDRLRDLSALEAVAPRLPPGFPELVHDLLAGLAAAGALPFPVRVRLASPRAELAPLVVRLLEALAAAGAEVADPPAPAPLAPADSDLGRVQRALLDPALPPPELRGDGSLLLLEADTPLEAAEVTASLLRGADLGRATAVASAEPGVLDAALARQGLPALGVSAASPFRPHLQLLPLRLLLAFRPQDPHRAAELLLLPGAPLPGHARRSLLGALDEMPGLGSPAWLRAVDEAVADEEQAAAGRGEGPAGARASAERLRAAVEAWFGGELHDPVAGIPAARAAALASAVATWIGGRVSGAVERARTEPSAAEDAALWSQAAAVARTLEQLLVARPVDERLTQQQLLQLHGLAVGNGSELAAFESEAGRPAVVGSPSQVAVPAALVLWWGFVQGADAGPLPEPWTEAERAALAPAGVRLSGPGARRAVEAAGWRRPLLAACERAVLVRWRLAGAEAAAPHAFLDELGTRVGPESLARCACASERLLSGGAAPWAAPLASLAPAAPMAQRPVWKAPAASLLPTASLSASALESLLGCPFQWALRHRGKLEPGQGVSLPEGSKLLGTFAHTLLQDMLCGATKLDFDRATAAEARAWAARAFDARVGLEAAPLVRRGAEVELDQARTLVANAAGALLELLQRSGWRPVEAEREVKGTFAGRPAQGFVDLVVAKGDREAVVDLKLGGLPHKQKALEEGRALQLALYASLLGKGGEPPPSAYFILDQGQLLTVYPQAFPGATVVEGDGAGATLRGAEEGFRYWEQVLGAGLLPVLDEALPWAGPVTAAAGPPPDAESSARREPPCRYCPYAAVCVAPEVEADEEEEVAP